MGGCMINMEYPYIVYSVMYTFPKLVLHARSIHFSRSFRKRILGFSELFIQYGGKKRQNITLVIHQPPIINNY